MEQKRSRHLDLFVVVDAFLIMIAAVLVFLVYREINHAPKVQADITASLVYQASAINSDSGNPVGGNDTNHETAFLTNWQSRTQKNLNVENPNLVLDFYSPLERFSQFSSEKTVKREEIFAQMSAESSEPMRKVIVSDEATTIDYFGAVYAETDCADCLELGTASYQKGDLIGIRSVSYSITNSFVSSITKLLVVLAIMTGILLVTSIFVLPMLRKSHRDRETMEKRTESAERAAMTDLLTGLPNRRYLDMCLDGFIAEFGKAGRGFGFMLLDLDHFKAVNDNFGHETGDMVLREVAIRLQSSMGELDTIARLGGEEFAVITPVSDEKQLVAMANRLRESIEKLHFKVGNSAVRPPISIGLAISGTAYERPAYAIQ